LSGTHKYATDEIIQSSKKLRAEIVELKKQLPKDTKLLNKEIEYIEKEITPYINSYKKVIEEHFFEIRDLFRWYNKEIRVYLCDDDSHKESYTIKAYVYPSDTNHLYIFPKKLKLYSLEFNIEELNKKSDLFYATFIEKPILDSNVRKNFFHIYDTLPFEEIIEIFWSVSSKQDKLDFLEKLFRLLGYSVEKHHDIKDVYKLVKLNINIEKFDLYDEKYGKKESLLILGDKKYLDKNDIDSLINYIQSKNLFDTAPNAIYTIAYLDTLSTEKLTQNGICNLDVKRLSWFLAKLNLTEFLIPFLKKVIMGIDKNRLDSEIEKSRRGNELKDKLDKLDTGFKTFKVFQDLIGDIFEFLFKDSFRNYYDRLQASEYEGHRIPDLVISNVNPIVDFWKLRKVEQNAKRIIVDFKNYSDEISQNTVHDVAKYLNHKKGNFAIIVTQKGINKSGLDELKIKYFDDDKLIIHLDARDLIEMINYKINGLSAEDILERKMAELSA